jgi:ribonucleoside-diphosphate reductase alpha chain
MSTLGLSTHDKFMSDIPINVLKRNNKLEPLNIDKINRILRWAVEGINNVSLSDIAVNAKLNFVDGITTREVHTALIDSASNLISIDTPEYQYVAGRLVNYQLRKDVWGGKHAPRLLDVIKNGIKENIYNKDIFDYYTEEEINKLGEYIDHDRDFTFTFAGIKQLCDKYLIKNRITNQLFETPQFAYMLIAIYGFKKAQHKTTIVKRFYDAISKHKINLPTPVQAGVRTNLESYASCCLIGVDDTKESITASGTAVSIATASRCGIGIDVSRIRSIGTPVKGGEIVHTGVVPFLKIYESSVKAWQQNAIRGGSATVNIQWWHAEIEDVVVLKNNAGTDDNRVRKLDYTIGMSKLFYDRVIQNKDITLFSPHEVKDLFEAWGTNRFDDLYLSKETDTSILFKKTISARKLFSLIVKERVETGRIYILNVDTANEHSAWLDKITMSNLCTEVIHPTIPLNDFNDTEGEIGMCILSAVNLLEIKNWNDLEKTCDLIVRFLDEIIDNQKYFNKAAENFAKKRRSLGVGITNLAALLAKNGLKYTDEQTPNFVDEWIEHLQYFLLKSSVQLAKEKGACEKYNNTKYSKGVLPIDTYKKFIDTFITRKLACDWETLRKDIKEFGLRNSTLTAFMPCESSSAVQSSTNGIEPVRSLLTYKTSKVSKLPVLAPSAKRWPYELAFKLKDNIGLLNVNAAIQKYCDMAISTNMYYNYAHYENGTLPDSKVMKEIMYAYKVGLVSLYYNNTDDGDKEQLLEADNNDCAGGACKL